MSKMSYLKKVLNTLLTRSNLLINIFKMVWCAAVGCNNNSRNQERKMLILYNLKSRERMIRVSSMLRQYVFLKYVHP